MELDLTELFLEDRITLASTTTSLDVLKDLIDDNSFYVRYSVAKNENITVELLDILSNDESLFVLGAVINSPKVSNEILNRLSASEDEDINFLLSNRKK